MVQFVKRSEAKALSRKEPVVFAEILGESHGNQTLEVHVVRPSAEGIWEVERDDTGPIPGEEVRALVERIAAAHGVQYATIFNAEDHWPPEWLNP